MSQWRARFVGMEFSNTDADGGAHCWGLIRRVYKEELGIELPSYSELSAEDMVAMAREVTDATTKGPWESVPKGQEQEFDVALIIGPVQVEGRAKPVRRINHVGIITNDRHVLHVEKASAAVCIPLNHETIKWRYAGAQRYVRPT